LATVSSGMKTLPGFPDQIEKPEANLKLIASRYLPDTP
jgi:hypothetical protein